PEPILISPPNGQHVVFVVNQNALGGKGGYFDGINHFTQGVANCVDGQPKSNEASMIFVGYDAADTANFELNENLVRGTAHEFQHLINFVDHAVLPAQANYEDRWINEGLSMLAQDLAVNRLYPSQTFDVADALYRAQQFLLAPQDYSLTAFTGYSPGANAFQYNCSGGCYGASYLFTRYLYDRFGGDTFTHAMESGANVSYANLQASTGQVPTSLISDFGVALMASNTGLTTDPRFNFTAFNPYGSYVDQFGDNLVFQGVNTFSQAQGTSVAYPMFYGTFSYITAPSVGGAAVAVSDPGNSLSLAPALQQR
ncbi:MAG TPA: hypothetical protein VGD50_01870, partial [Candidatus Baltobacteraceae bacterium]